MVRCDMGSFDGMTGIACPSCSGTLLVSFSNIGSQLESSNQVLNAQCPLCETVFPIGIIQERYEGLVPDSAPSGRGVVRQALGTVTKALSSVGTSGPASRLRSRVRGNPRADVKNPNNPAHRAAATNRANQFNPNHRANRSSKGKR